MNTKIIQVIMTEKNPSKPGRRSEGLAGASREVSQRDQIASGAGCAGRNHEDVTEARPVMPAPPRGQSVFRKTELYGTLPETTPAEARKIRQRTMESLKGPGATVEYQPFERAFRDFTCSLMEQQALIEEDLLLQIANLQQQIDALERIVKELRHASTTENPEVRA
jgi:hypothetical protein